MKNDQQQFPIAGFDTSRIRISLTVPESLREDLDYVAIRMGISRSALVSGLLADPVAALVEILVDVPENSSESDMKRARGRSLEIVTQRLSQYFGTIEQQEDDS